MPSAFIEWDSQARGFLVTEAFDEFIKTIHLIDEQLTFVRNAERDFITAQAILETAPRLQRDGMHT